ncbi:MAG: hypothetical protein RL011_2127 [Pseudomonadota bacterium]|jgi:hypothetical protein
MRKLHHYIIFLTLTLTAVLVAKHFAGRLATQIAVATGD